MSDLIHEEKNRRMQKLRSYLQKTQADACVITSSVNQFYLLDFIFDGYLYILPDEEPLLFVKRPNNVAGNNVVQIRRPEQIPEFLQERNKPLPRRLLLESDTLAYIAAVRIQAALGTPEILNVSTEIREIRAIKSEYEVSQMRECAQIHAKVYERIPSLYRPGMTDLELQIEIERQMRLHGSIGLFRSFGENMDIFMGSVLAGDNAQAASPFDFALGGKGISPLLPLGANGTTLTPGMTIMVDMAGNYRSYMDDMTRTFAVGKVPEIAYQAHQVSIDIHNAIEQTAKSGIPCAELYLRAQQAAAQNNLQAYFMGTGQQAKFVGHGVGLEINEPPVLTPRSREILQEGMAIAVEPKFVLPGIGPVGIENTYIVQKNGLEKITLCREKILSLQD